MKIFFRTLTSVSAGWIILLLIGCATPVPMLVHDGYRKSAVDSAVLRVGRFWVEQAPGQATVLKGHLSRKSPDGDTSKSYLLISLRDSSGRELLSKKIGFEPQAMAEDWGPHAQGATFRHAFADFPANVAEIVVKAVD